MRGRRPMPTTLRAFRGTLRPDRANRAEPRLPLAVPACPVHLGAAARRVWPELVALVEPMRVLTLSDALALAHWADAEAKWRRWSAQLERVGPTYRVTTASGTIERLRPLVGAVADLDRRVKGWAEEFGCGPAARARVHAQPPERKDGDQGWAALVLPSARREGRSA